MAEASITSFDEVTGVFRRSLHGSGIVGVLPLDAGTENPTGPGTFTSRHGAHFEMAYGDMLHDFITNPARGKFQISIDDINTFLKDTDNEEVRQTFSRPWNENMGISLENAQKAGIVVPDITPPHVRTFFGIDGSGYIYQTLPSGHRITSRGELGTIYDSLDGPNNFADFVRKAIANKVNDTFGGTNVMGYLTVMDQALGLEARRKILEKDDVDSKADSLAILKKLISADSKSMDVLKEAIKLNQSPLPSVEIKEAVEGETEDQKKSREAANLKSKEKYDEALRQREKRIPEETEKNPEYPQDFTHSIIA